MKFKAIVGLLVAVGAATTTSADSNILNRLVWSGETSTHLYNAEHLGEFTPSLELGLRTELPLLTADEGQLLIGAGLSFTGVMSSSKLNTPITMSETTFPDAQIDHNRFFLSAAFETPGTWFVKPEVGVERVAIKLRLTDTEAGQGYAKTESSVQAFGAIGIGKRFADNKEAVLSFATLSNDGDQDFRITLSGSL